MNGKGHKFVRFEDWRSESSFSIEQIDSVNKRKERPSVSSILKSIGRGFEIGLEKMKKFIIPSSAVYPVSEGQTKKLATSKRKVLDPQGPMLQKWNKIFVVTCVMAISVDPLFFYIPVIVGKNKCLYLDETLQTTASVLRTFFDLFYILRIIFQFRTGFIAPSSRVFGRGELVDDPVAIMKRYLSSHFIIDILSIIPLPQVIVLAIIPNLKSTGPFLAKDLLKYTVLIQYVPRLLRIRPLFQEVTRTSGILAETAWAGAVFNLLLYMLASHVVGANWYLLSIESQVRCWRRELNNASLFHASYLGCGPRNQTVFQLLNTTCTFVDPDEIKDTKTFNFGIFSDALQSLVIDSTTEFPQKFFYCFWWGLRNLSSLGQNLKTTTYVPEIAFAIFIAIFGLVLFSLLIGNMQKYLESTTVRVEEMRVKRRDAERWMSHRMLPDNLKKRIRSYEQYKWQENRGVEEETLIRTLPKDLRRDIKRHLCLALVKKVPMFEKMDEQLLDAMCDRLKPVLYTEKSCIVREEDPVDEMIFIMRGKVKTMTTNGGRTGFFNSLFLNPGDFCGEELLTWALDPNSSSNLPTSTRTVETISEVEAFALMADDLKFVASQFRRLINSKQLQHTFRLYSPQWKTWSVCFIQAAWRRYRKKKIEKTLREAEDKLQDALANEEGSTISLGATIYASRFAANALRNLRENNRHNRMPQRLLPLLPPKPAEPDFTTKKN
ncbi:Cyclic nucleotide-gated ion channel 1 [Trifolium repens]|nr:Cyclic nucleotide-gated ion channel 1 [Trifolium repens]